jgi:hypothetical protein
MKIIYYIRQDIYKDSILIAVMIDRRMSRQSRQLVNEYLQAVKALGRIGKREKSGRPMRQIV